MKVARSSALARTLTAALVVALAAASYAEKSSSTSNVKRLCSVTRPNGNSPKIGQPPRKLRSFNHGNGSLWIALWWPRRGVLAGIAPDGGAEATIEADGSIHLKVGWYRGANGKLVAYAVGAVTASGVSSPSGRITRNALAASVQARKTISETIAYAPSGA
jgi:hypothetical protein